MVADELKVDIEGLEEFLDDPRFSAALEDADARRWLLCGLVKQRNAAQLTQSDVAKHMETTQSFVSDLENAKTDPHLSTLQRYARAVAAKLEIKIALPHDCNWQVYVSPQSSNTWAEGLVRNTGSTSRFVPGHLATA